MNSKLNIKAPALAAFCAKYYVRRLSLFGSILKGKQGNGSDIDFLIEFEDGRTPGLMALAKMEAELALLAGRKVDLQTPQDLSHYFRQEVLDSAEVQYAR